MALLIASIYIYLNFMADTIYLILIMALNIVGIVGCFVPMLPGPPFSFLALCLIYLRYDGVIGGIALAIYGIVTIVTLVLDYLVPSLGVKYFGGTKWGKWGSVIGTIIGLGYFPVGLILGPFFGAFIGELIGRSGGRSALKSGIGSLLGFMFGVLMKFVVCIYFLCVSLMSLWEIAFS